MTSRHYPATALSYLVALVQLTLLLHIGSVLSAEVNVSVSATTVKPVTLATIIHNNNNSNSVLEQKTPQNVLNSSVASVAVQNSTRTENISRPRQTCPYCAGSECSDCIPGYIWDPVMITKVFIALFLGAIGFYSLFFFYKKWAFLNIPYHPSHRRSVKDPGFWSQDTLEYLQTVLKAIEGIYY